MLNLQKNLANIGCPKIEQQLDLIVRIANSEIPVRGFLKDYIRHLYDSSNASSDNTSDNTFDVLSDESLKRILLLICSQNRDVDAKVFEMVIDWAGHDIVSKSKREFMSTAVYNGSIKIVQFLLDRFCIQRDDIDTTVLCEAYELGGYVEVFDLLAGSFELNQLRPSESEIPYYYSGAEPLDDYHAIVYVMWINYLTRVDKHLPDSMLISPMTKSASFGVV
jgi:hypothetical protein